MTRRPMFGALLALSLLAPLGALAQTGFSNLFVFGDSLSDNGNLAAMPGFDYLQNPPFDLGFSNGERAVEVLGDSLGLTADPSRYLLGAPVGTNYSVAGARARGILPIDLTAQVASFLQNHGGTAPSDALYVVFIGGNDIRDARDTTKDSLANRYIKDAVSGVDINVRRLINAGAKSIMVVNSPDLGAIPESLQSKKTSQRATKLTTQFNSQLATRVAQIEHDLDIDLVAFDLFGFFQTVLHDSQALGFSDTTHACYDSTALVYNPGCDFDTYLFFDDIHPTARAQGRTGRAFYSAVPEPALDAN